MPDRDRIPLESIHYPLAIIKAFSSNVLACLVFLMKFLYAFFAFCYSFSLQKPRKILWYDEWESKVPGGSGDAEQAEAGCREAVSVQLIVVTLSREKAMEDFTNAEAIKSWSTLPEELIENFGDEGVSQ